MNMKRLFRTVLIAAAVSFIAGAVFGTLAIPVVLAVNCSIYWLFLYAVYTLMVLYVVMYFIRYWHDEPVPMTRQ